MHVGCMLVTMHTICQALKIDQILVRKVSNLYPVKPIYEIEVDYWGQT